MTSSSAYAAPAQAPQTNAWERFGQALARWFAASAQTRAGASPPTPLITRLAAGDMGPSDGAEADLVRRFSELAQAPDLGRRIVTELARVVAEPTHAPTPASQHAWVLWAGPNDAKLTLARIPAGGGDDASFLTDSACRQLVATLAGETTEIAVHHQHAPDPEVMDPAAALTPATIFRLGPGEVLSVRARRDVYDILPQPVHRHLLIFDFPRELTQQWVYARADLRPVSPVAADPHDARIESAMRLLRVMQHPRALPARARLVSYPAHFVRWSAVRHAAALEVQAGKELL